MFFTCEQVKRSHLSQNDFNRTFFWKRRNISTSAACSAYLCQCDQMVGKICPIFGKKVAEIAAKPKKNKLNIKVKNIYIKLI